jgi:hypothetical protein
MLIILNHNLKDSLEDNQVVNNNNSKPKKYQLEMVVELDQQQ